MHGSKLQRSTLPTIGNEKRYEARDTWSEANREVALVLLNENPGPSKVHKSSKGTTLRCLALHCANYACCCINTTNCGWQ